MPLGSYVNGSTVTFDVFLRWATQGPVGPLVWEIHLHVGLRPKTTYIDADVCCFWPQSYMDLSKNKLKPNKLINWLIFQEMLLGIIILRLMNMCCATKQFTATKISNRKITNYLWSDGFVYKKKSGMDLFGRCSWRSIIPLIVCLTR